MEMTPLSSFLLCLSVTVILLWLRLVFRRLFVTVIVIILWLLRIFITEIPFVLVLKFILDFKEICCICRRKREER
jgi:hypothetical protein